MSDAEEEVKTHPCDKYKIPDCPGMIPKIRVEVSAGYFSNLNGNHKVYSNPLECFWNHFLVEEMNPLEQRWFKIKSFETFPVKVKYYGDCGLPLEYVEYLPDALRDQALEVIIRGHLRS